MKQSIQGLPIFLNQALGATVNSPPVQVEWLYAPFIQLKVTDQASLDGVLTVQGSNFLNSRGEPVEWVTLTEFASKTITANGDSYWFLPTTMLTMKFIRLVWTRTAGSGNITARLSTGR